jgi:hypothetical protein
MVRPSRLPSATLPDAGGIEIVPSIGPTEAAISFHTDQAFVEIYSPNLSPRPLTGQPQILAMG